MAFCGGIHLHLSLVRTAYWGYVKLAASLPQSTELGQKQICTCIQHTSNKSHIGTLVKIMSENLYIMVCSPFSPTLPSAQRTLHAGNIHLIKRLFECSMDS